MQWNLFTILYCLWVQCLFLNRIGFFFNFLVENGGKKQKMAKPIKGYLSSSNAYLLVYTASDFGLDSTPLTEDSLQEHLRTKLNEYNDSFDSVISQSREEKVCC